MDRETVEVDELRSQSRAIRQRGRDRRRPYRRMHWCEQAWAHGGASPFLTAVGDELLKRIRALSEVHGGNRKNRGPNHVDEFERQ
jgi:hypothetical protein